MKECIICGATDQVTRIIKSSTGELFCRKHYLQIYKHGFTYSTIYDDNEYVTEGATTKIILKDQNGYIVGEAIIDTEDVELVKPYKWHIKKSRNTSYCVSSIGNHKIFLHRLVTGYDGGDDVDHIDHNGLNNTKTNLRVVSHKQNLLNQHNDSNGVYQVRSGRYRATIAPNGKTIYLGTYNTFEEAKTARKDKEQTLI